MGDHLIIYSKFFEDFNKSVDTTDQLPVKIIAGVLRDHDIIGSVIDWTQQYLSSRQCPTSLIAQLCKLVVTEMEVYRMMDSESCGFQKDSQLWNPLKLMQATIRKVIEVCSRYNEPSNITKLSPPRSNMCRTVLSCNKNSRRVMEDKFTIIDDLHEMLNIEGYGSASFYGVFDGHGGVEASMYTASQLFQFLVESQHYPTRPDLALVNSFKKTDACFVEKAKTENLQSGTTVVVALLLQELKQLYIAWIGDSQALISKKGKVSQLVDPPHKPSLESERSRIEAMGGCVLHYNEWRVQGTLAVSRAIGDKDFKPYVSADPDVSCLLLDGTEDFLVLASDGLWEEVSEIEIALTVYTHLIKYKDQDLKTITDSLIKLAKSKGSKDNITVLLVFLKPPLEIPASESLAHLSMDTITTSTPSYNGTGSYHQQNDHDDDFGPETDVDGVHHDEHNNMTACVGDLKDENDFTTDVKNIKNATNQKILSQEQNVLNLSSAGSSSDSEEGEDNEEWNFVKGGKENKEPFSDQQQHQNQENHNYLDPDDDMNHPLNPDAAEFVPISSPDRMMSPVHNSHTITTLDAFDNDQVIASSPNRPKKIANIFDEGSFMEDIKNRTSGGINEFENNFNSGVNEFENVLKSGVNEFENVLKSGVNDFENGLKSEVNDFENGLKSGVNDFENGLKSGVNEFENGLKSGANEFENGLKSKVLDFDSDHNGSFNDDFNQFDQNETNTNATMGDTTTNHFNDLSLDSSNTITLNDGGHFGGGSESGHFGGSEDVTTSSLSPTSPSSDFKNHQATIEETITTTKNEFDDTVTTQNKTNYKTIQDDDDDTIINKTPDTINEITYDEFHTASNTNMFNDKTNDIDEDDFTNTSSIPEITNTSMFTDINTSKIGDDDFSNYKIMNPFEEADAKIMNSLFTPDPNEKRISSELVDKINFYNVEHRQDIIVESADQVIIENDNNIPSNELISGGDEYELNKNENVISGGDEYELNKNEILISGGDENEFNTNEILISGDENIEKYNNTIIKDDDDNNVKTNNFVNNTMVETDQFEFHRENNSSPIIDGHNNINKEIEEDLKEHVLENKDDIESGQDIEITGTSVNDFITKNKEFIERPNNDNEIDIEIDEDVMKPGKLVSDLNEENIMSRSFYGDYNEGHEHNDEQRSLSPSDEMIDHYANQQQHHHHQVEEVIQQSDKIEENYKESFNTLEAKLANENIEQNETIFEETETIKEEEQQQHPNQEINKKETEEEIKDEIITTLETNLDDFTSQETKIENDFIEKTNEEIIKPIENFNENEFIQQNNDEKEIGGNIVENIDLIGGSNVPTDSTAEEVKQIDNVINEEVKPVDDIENNKSEDKILSAAAIATGVAAIGAAAAATVAAKKSTSAIKKSTTSTATTTKKLDTKPNVSKSSVTSKPSTTSKLSTTSKPSTTSKSTLGTKPTSTTATAPLKKSTTSTLKSSLTASRPKTTTSSTTKSSTAAASTTAAAEKPKPPPIRRPIPGSSTTIKSTTSTTSTTTTKPPGTTASKPSTTTRPATSSSLSKTSTTSTAPKSRSTTSATSKPLTNGIAKRPASATSTATKSTTSNAISKTSKTLPLKPSTTSTATVPRVPLSQRTYSATSTSKTATAGAAAKPTTSTLKKTTTTTRKPLSSVTSKISSKTTTTSPTTKSSLLSSVATKSNAIKKTEKQSTTTTTSDVSLTTPPSKDATIFETTTRSPSEEEQINNDDILNISSENSTPIMNGH